MGVPAQAVGVLIVRSGHRESLEVVQLGQVVALFVVTAPPRTACFRQPCLNTKPTTVNIIDEAANAIGKMIETCS